MVKLTEKPTWLAVSAIWLTRPDGRLLLQQRPLHKHHGGLWELPGGKVENGEIPRVALCRELMEELAIALDPAALQPAGFAEEAGDPAIVLLLYTCTDFSGKIVPQEGQATGWFTLEDAARLPLAPMDRCLLNGRSSQEKASNPLAKPKRPPYVAPSTAHP